MQRKNRVKVFTDFLPIDMLYDPQSSAEKLFSKLKKSNDKYEVKLLMLRLVSRLIGRHSLLLLQFYPFILRYLNSHEKEKIGEIFAMIIESCHDLVPPEDVKPVIERILNNYANEYAPLAHIVIGINTIREILIRMPLALEESQIEYLVQFRSHRNSSVRAAAKALINFFRDVCPHMLPKKFIGRFTVIDDSNKELIYGQQKVATTIEGIELLGEGANVATERMLTDKDFKKIKLMQLRQAAKKVDKKGFASESSEGEEEDEMDVDEKGEDEMDADDLDDEDLEDEDLEDAEGEDGEEEMESEDDIKDKKKLAEKKYAEMHSSDGEDVESDELDDLESGEFWEEGEAEMLESEDEEEAKEEDEEEAPQLVPIGEDRQGREAKKGDKKRSKSAPAVSKKEFESDLSSESEESEDEEIDVNELSSDALDEALQEFEDSDDEPENQHGFVYAHNLNTYRLNKKERIEQMKKEEEQDDDGRKDYQRKRDKKRARKHGKTNIEKLKNKPMAMVLPKKVKDIKTQRDRVESKKKINKRNIFLGKYTKHKSQQLEARKRRKTNI